MWFCVYVWWRCGELPSVGAVTLKVEVAASYVLFGVQERGEEKKCACLLMILMRKRKKNPAGWLADRIEWKIKEFAELLLSHGRDISLFFPYHAFLLPPSPPSFHSAFNCTVCYEPFILNANNAVCVFVTQTCLILFKVLARSSRGSVGLNVSNWGSLRQKTYCSISIVDSDLLWF